MKSFSYSYLNDGIDAVYLGFKKLGLNTLSLELQRIHANFEGLINCSELVAKAYSLGIGLRLCPGIYSGDVTPQDLASTQSLETVKYA